MPKPLAEATGDGLAWDEAVGALRAYSLVEVKGEAISVHRLVQAVVGDRLDEAGGKKWASGSGRHRSHVRRFHMRPLAIGSSSRHGQYGSHPIILYITHF